MSSLDKERRIDVIGILTIDNPYAKDVVHKYNKFGELSDKGRTTVVDAIIEFALQNNIKISVQSIPMMKNFAELSNEICEFFPTETPVSVTYIPKN